LPRDLDPLRVDQYQLRGLAQDLVLRRADLSFKDLDGEILPA